MDSTTRQSNSNYRLLKRELSQPANCFTRNLDDERLGLFEFFVAGNIEHGMTDDKATALQAMVSVIDTRHSHVISEAVIADLEGATAFVSLLRSRLSSPAQEGGAK